MMLQQDTWEEDHLGGKLMDPKSFRTSLTHNLKLKKDILEERPTGRGLQKTPRRRHFFGPTLLEPGFDLHVLCGEGPAAKAQRAYPAEYQRLDKWCTSLPVVGGFSQLFQEVGVLVGSPTMAFPCFGRRAQLNLLS